MVPTATGLQAGTLACKPGPGHAPAVLLTEACNRQVIEAAIENVKLKQQIFADLEKACRPEAILSSNTSTIDISLVSLWGDLAAHETRAHDLSSNTSTTDISLVSGLGSSGLRRDPADPETKTRPLPSNTSTTDIFSGELVTMV